MRKLIILGICFALLTACEKINDNQKEAAQYFSQFSKADRAALLSNMEQNRQFLIKSGFNKFVFDRDQHTLDEINHFFDSLGRGSDNPYFKVKIIRHSILDYGLAERTDKKSKERLGEYVEILAKSPHKDPEVFMVGLEKIKGYWEHDRVARAAEFEIYKTQGDLNQIDVMLNDPQSKLSPQEREEIIKIQAIFNKQIEEIKRIASL